MCPTCHKEPDKKKDVREVSRESDIDARYIYHCPDCLQVLTSDEHDAVTRSKATASCTVPEE